MIYRLHADDRRAAWQQSRVSVETWDLQNIWKCARKISYTFMRSFNFSTAVDDGTWNTLDVIIFTNCPKSDTDDDESLKSIKFLILTNMRDLPPHHHLNAHTYGLFWLGKTLKPLSRRNNCFEYGEWHTHESERAKRRNAKRENSKNEFAHSKYRHASDIYLKWLPSFFVLGCDRLCFCSATFSSLPEIYGEARECKNVSSTDLECQSFSVHCLSPPIHYSSTSVQSKSWLSSLFINTSHITSPKWPGMFVCSSTCVLNRGHARLFDLIRN